MQDVADICCKARTSELKRIRQAVKHACEDFALSSDKTSAVILAIDEACANVIRHSCAFSDKFNLEIKVSKEKNYGIFLIIDNCPPISPECLQPKTTEPLQPGGLGLHLIHQVMDSVALLPHKGRGNTLELKIKI